MNLLLISLLAVLAGSAAAGPTVDNAIRSEIAAKGTTVGILHFAGGEPTSSIVARFSSERRFNPADRDVLPSLLEANAAKAQAKTLEFLEARQKTNPSASGSNIHQLWILNQLIVRDLDAELLEAFEANPDITRIEADKTYQLLAPTQASETFEDTRAERTNQWGVIKVGAPEVWPEYDGTGVVVGIIDTGANYNHPDLKPGFRALNGWRDFANMLPPILQPANPQDPHGHGSHTTGTIAGRNGIGVAPGAQWIHCRALDVSGAATDANLRSCGDWMMKPTDRFGNNGNSSLAPRLVSNSWGSNTLQDPFFNAIIDAWLAQGIVPVFANGNNGPSPGTTGSPGYYQPCTSVGATDDNGLIASFSSRGPVTYGGVTYISPDVSGPGVDITSASNIGNGYAVMSGTSMATPHVAGVMALAISANPSISATAMKSFIIATSVTTGLDQSNPFPNNNFGHGIVNAPRAVAAALRM